MFNQAKIIVGDNRKTIAKLEAGSVQTCITSPPYWGLRDYGTATWLGGDESCDHLGKPMATRANVNSNTGGRDVKNADYREPMGQVCTKCGATREDDQIGLEQTPDEYVEQLCLVFDEVWRVLADDGTLWLNLGDSYNGAAPNRSGANGFNDGRTNRDKRFSVGGVVGLKPKDLVGIPWRVAFALQARGWYLRSEIIWHKPNPMPESVTDRPTKSHEHIFLLSKSAKYFYDHEAIKDDALTEPTNPKSIPYSQHIQKGGKDSQKLGTSQIDGKRNKRDVWTVATQPFAGAHFAVYPPALIEPCILAGTSEYGNCVGCGKGWTRQVERPKPPQVEPSSLDRYGNGKAGVHRKTGQAYQNWLNENPVKTVGWAKVCGCVTNEVKPAIVIDPFSGSGTTGVVALRNGRNYIGTELNPEYAALSKQRIGDDCGMFGDVEVIGETE